MSGTERAHMQPSSGFQPVLRPSLEPGGSSRCSGMCYGQATRTFSWFSLPARTAGTPVHWERVLD